MTTQVKKTEAIATQVSQGIAQGVPKRDDIMPENKFAGLCNSIAKQGKATRELVQQAAMQALLFAFVHANFDRMSILYKTVKDNMSERNSSQLQLWFEAHSPAVLRKTEDKNYEDGKKFRKSNSDTANAFDLDKAYNTPWYEMQGLTPEEVEKFFGTSDYVKRLETILKAIDKARTEGKIGESDIEQVAQLESRLKEVVVQFKPMDKAEVADAVELVKAQAA